MQVGWWLRYLAQILQEVALSLDIPLAKLTKLKPEN